MPSTSWISEYLRFTNSPRGRQENASSLNVFGSHSLNQSHFSLTSWPFSFVVTLTIFSNAPQNRSGIIKKLCIDAGGEEIFGNLHLKETKHEDNEDNLQIDPICSKKSIIIV